MHDHSHNHGNEGTRIGWAFFLNVGFTIIEFIGGVLTNSTAIMADAVHDLGDSLSIGFSWLLARLSGKQANRLLKNPIYEKIAHPFTKGNNDAGTI